MFNKLLITSLLLFVGVPVFADSNRITPYGDYCRECTRYGTGTSIIPVENAVAAIAQYYGDKGCSVGRVWHRGRFIEAEIYRGNRLVDKVLFDRKSGRLRSMY